MLHTTILIVHIISACGALVSGFWALNVQHKPRTHRLLGKVYLAMWVLLAGGGMAIGWGNPGITIFEVLNVLGFGTVCIAYGAVLFRRHLGRAWLRVHYNWTVNSLAFLVIATVNQVLPRVGIEYPIWVFLLMVASPSLVIPLYVRRLDRRYGFAKPTTPDPEHGVAQGRAKVYTR